MLYRTIQDFNPQYVTICFDTPKPTFRKKLFKQYQIHRPKMEKDLSLQFPMVKELLENAGVFHEEKAGYEADDVIGTIVKSLPRDQFKILILTGDKDLMQLVDGNVYTITPQIGFSKTKIFDRKEVVAKFGIRPEQIPDYKALAGDPSDNYPGAKGIGPKTASRLIHEYSSVENLFKNLDRLPEKIKAILKKNKRDILLSKKLAQIVTNLKVKFLPKNAQFTGFKPELKDSLLKLEMYSLANRFFNTRKKEEKKTKKTSSKAITDSSQIGLF
jgi:DNA polymerase-1